MRRSHAALLATLVPALGGWDVLKSNNRQVEEGNARMRDGKAEEALGFYDKAASRLPGDPALHFNRGAALHALDRFDEAGQEFLRATEAKDPALKAAAFYNLGNAFFKKDKFKEAIEAYKRSLALDPKDTRAKWNLELALRRKQEEEKKKEQDQKEKGDGQQDKDKNKDKGDEKKDDGQNQPQPQPQPQTQPQESPAEHKPAEPPPSEKPASPEEVQQILDALEKSPKNLERERARMRAVRRRPQKDW